MKIRHFYSLRLAQTLLAGTISLLTSYFDNEIEESASGGKNFSTNARDFSTKENFSNHLISYKKAHLQMKVGLGFEL